MEPESSSHMACLLKIDSHTTDWEKSLNEVLATIQDISFTIDQPSKTVYVRGKMDIEAILQKIRGTGKYAEVVWIDHDQSKNHRTMMMNPCPNKYYSSGAPINYPNVFPPHHQYYPYPNQCYLSFPPPPYPRQMYPHEPPEPLYGYQRYEPVARNFPPTPPPPKNFVVGDLQCIIM